MWLLESPEAEIPLAYDDELEDEEGREILRLLGRRWTRPQRVLVRYDGETKTVLSYLCEASESDWSQEERDQWYKERPKDEEYYRIQRELLKDGLTRKAKLVKLPPHQEGEPGLWAIGLEGASPLKLPAAEQHPLHASLAFDDELSEEQLQALQDEWGEERDVSSRAAAAGSCP
eukprot:s8192_g5.t1